MNACNTNRTSMYQVYREFNIHSVVHFDVRMCYALHREFML
jgi:hypothetical protein